MIVGIPISYFVWCCRRRLSKNKNPQPQTIELDTRNKIQTNPEAETVEADTTYQQLDLTKMNKEDNYQSLIMNRNTSSNNAESFGDDFTYTELNKVRDVENDYQSLT